MPGAGSRARASDRRRAVALALPRTRRPRRRRWYSLEDLQIGLQRAGLTQGLHDGDEVPGRNAERVEGAYHRAQGRSAGDEGELAPLLRCRYRAIALLGRLTVGERV